MIFQALLVVCMDVLPSVETLAVYDGKDNVGGETTVELFSIVLNERGLQLYEDILDLSNVRITRGDVLSGRSVFMELPLVLMRDVCKRSLVLFRHSIWLARNNA